MIGEGDKEFDKNRLGYDKRFKQEDTIARIEISF